jgi:hypothetical protein
MVCRKVIFCKLNFKKVNNLFKESPIIYAGNKRTSYFFETGDAPSLYQNDTYRFYFKRTRYCVYLYMENVHESGMDLLSIKIYKTT